MTITLTDGTEIKDVERMSALKGGTFTVAYRTDIKHGFYEYSSRLSVVSYKANKRTVQVGDIREITP